MNGPHVTAGVNNNAPAREFFGDIKETLPQAALKIEPHAFVPVFSGSRCRLART